VDSLRSRGETGAEGGARRRGFEASRVSSQLVVALRVEGKGVGKGEETDVRAEDVETGPDVECAHAFGPQDPLVPGEGVHVGA
jgi:hypothetical protein